MPSTYDFDLYLAQLDRQCSPQQDYFTNPSSEWAPMFADNSNTNPLAVDHNQTDFWSSPSTFESLPSQSPDEFGSRNFSPSATACSSPSGSEIMSPRMSKKRSANKHIKRIKRRGSDSLPTTRKPHKEIEQKYRKSVNAAIQALQHSVPNLSSAGHTVDCQPQLTKVAVLIGATKYIQELTQERDRLRLRVQPWDNRA